MISVDRYILRMNLYHPQLNHRCIVFSILLQVLCMVELIPKLSLDQIIPALPKNSIAPETYDAFVEMVVLGLRNLAPYKFVKMQNPYLEIEVSKSATSTTVVKTAPSKRPDSSNPNFLGEDYLFI